MKLHSFATPLLVAAELLVTQLFAVEHLPAQSDAVFCQPPLTLHIAPDRSAMPRPADGGSMPNLPQVPQSAFPEYSHERRVIPAGPDRGQSAPATPEARFAEEEPHGPLGSGQFTYFRNNACRPANTATSASVEPSASINRDTMLVTGNWFAGLSRDGGQTFTSLVPANFFPSIDGGFCCDQRTEYVKSHDLTVWYLQYAYSASTAKGSIVLAVAPGRDRLRSGLAADWTRYPVSPQDLGFPTGHWFDFPDVSYTDDFFYWTSNVFRRNANGSNTFIAAVCVRMDLGDMQAGRPATGAAFRGDLGGNGGGFAWRLANGGNGAPMFWADTIDTTTIRIWRWQVGGSVDFVDRGIATFSAVPAIAIAADGRPWMGNATGRIRGAWGQADEIGFLWTSAVQAGRPNPYVRVARFTTPARNLIAEHDVWSSVNAIGYAAAEANSLGHVGIVLARGASTSFPHSAATIVDGYQPWGSAMTFTTMASGSAGPLQNSWGDYFDVQRHWVDERTFLGTGTLMTSSSASTSRVAWFGRDDYQPGWVSLDVTSTGATSVPITLDVTDRNGNKDGTTHFSRSFAPRQGYQLTAPLRHSSGGRDWVFERWAYTLSPGASLRLHTLGDPVLTVDDISTSDDTAEARYLEVRTLSIESFNPSSGITVTLDSTDLNGQRDGTTPFTRQFADGTPVTLTAPDRGASHPFRRWQRGNTFNTNRTASITIGGDDTLVAQYWTYTTGSVVTFGSGCPGTGAAIPGHRAVGTPEIGQTVSYEIRHLPSANLPGMLHFGQRAATPIPLALLGMGTCYLHVSPIAFNLGFVLDGSGTATLPLPIPNDIALIGAAAATQAAVYDPGTATPTKWVESPAVEVTLGGLGY